MMWLSKYRTNIVKFLPSEYRHLFKISKVGLVSRRKTAEYFLLDARRQSNACCNHIENRRAFVSWQCGSRLRRTNGDLDNSIFVNRSFLILPLKTQIEVHF